MMMVGLVDDSGQYGYGCAAEEKKQVKVSVNKGWIY
jgi:hypothetical protein